MQFAKTTLTKIRDVMSNEVKAEVKCYCASLNHHNIIDGEVVFSINMKPFKASYRADLIENKIVIKSSDLDKIDIQQFLNDIVPGNYEKHIDLEYVYAQIEDYVRAKIFEYMKEKNGD